MQPVTIIGAGIGGLTTALALQQCGITVHIYEAAPEIRPVGAGIVMAGNAMQVFRKLGLQQRIENTGNRMAVMNITDEQLRLLSAMRPDLLEQQYGVCNTAIHRADLQMILADAVGWEHISLSKRLSAAEQHPDGFRLHFEDGSDAGCGILIGADGIRSVVRQCFFPHTVIRDSGQVCWRGICETTLPPEHRHHAVEAWGKGVRLGITQISDNKVYWYAVANKKRGTAPGLLRELFHDFHPLLSAIVLQTPDSSIHFSAIEDLKPFDHWTAGNMCLVGDAAHATTPNLGQGACQAVEDAYVLGKLLGAGLPTDRAFRRYEQIRRNKAHSIVKQSRMLGRIAHIEYNTLRWLRNWLMKQTPSFLANRQLKWLFDIGEEGKMVRE